MAKATFFYLSVGIEANDMEYQYSLDHPEDCRVIPTISRHLGGLIVIQHRGQAAVESDLRQTHAFSGHTVDGGFPEADKPKQYCHFGGRLRLADYGNPATCQFLHATYV